MIYNYIEKKVSLWLLCDVQHSLMMADFLMSEAQQRIIVSIFMACRAILIITFHGVESIYIYVFVSLAWLCDVYAWSLMAVARKRMRVWATEQPGRLRKDAKLLITVVYSRETV